MRRFSQRGHLVTLSEINVTPLIDLAFTLLIIFVITTPLLEQGLDLTLPKGGTPDSELRKEDFRTIEIDPQGRYVYNKRQMDLAQIDQQLTRDLAANPKLAVYIRADQITAYDYVFKITELCAEHGVRVSFRSVAEE